MKASELMAVLKEAIRKHGDYPIEILCEDATKPELNMVYAPRNNTKGWYVNLYNHHDKQ